MSLGEFEHRIAGIPCRIAVLHYHAEPEIRHGHPDTWTAADTDAEWEVRDSRGRRADWLAAKLTEDEYDIVDRLVAEFMEAE